MEEHVEDLDKFLKDLKNIDGLSREQKRKMVIIAASRYNPKPSLEEIDEYLRRAEKNGLL